ncbi:MAG: hypothetical protein JXL97_13760 [Bacteroidales bacterium]|nr:hypothetical protein [Bacteroidales bacterium]
MPTNPQNKFVKNPYPGIRSFNIEESYLFFGREKQVSELSEIIKKNHFAAISGASGSGKSSIVKAGLIPNFLKEYQDLEYIIFRPGNNPLKNLIDKLTEFYVNAGIDRKEVKRQLSELHRNPNAFEDVINAFEVNKKFLIYIDQFEEIFRYRDNDFIRNAEETSEIFIQNIINATKSKKVDVFVVLSLRSDFLSDCTVFTGLPEMINKGHYLLPKLTLQQKEDAIRKPAEQAGAVFSPTLLDQIREDIKKEEVSLPVMQHALMRTWDYWLHNSLSNSAIDKEHYEAIGTVYNALSVHAENIFNSLNDKQKKLVEKIFRALTFGGNDERSTRSPQKLSQLVKICGAREMEIIEVVDKFRAEGSSFLMPSEFVQLKSDTVVDISHESIMHVWHRLSEWVEYETNSAQVYMRLSRSATLYQEGKTGLLVNPDLQIALSWLEEDKPNQEWANRYDAAFDRVVNYVLFSKKEFDKAVAARAEKQKRSLKRARIIAVFLGSATLVSILFMIVAMNLRFKAVQSEKDALSKQELAVKQSKIAEERRKDAVALQLVAKQQQEIAEQNRLIAEKQKQYAVAQQKEALYQKQQADIAKNEAFIARDLARQLQIEAEKLRDDAIEQKIIATNEKLRAENSEAKTDTLRKLSVAQTMAVKSIKLYEDNKKSQNLTEEDKNLPNILALQAYYFNKKYGGTIYNPDVFSAFLVVGESVEKITEIHTDAVRDLIVSPDGKSFLTASDDGSIYEISLDDVSKRKKVNTSESNNYRIVEYSPTEEFIVAGSKSGEISMWKKSNIDQKPQTSNIHKSIISEIVFVSENSFVSTSIDGKVILWSISDGFFSKVKEYSTFKKNVSASYNKAFGQIVIASESGLITFLAINDLSVVNEISSSYGKISVIRWVDSGDLYVGFTNGLVAVLNNGSYDEKDKWFAHNSTVTEILYNSTNNLVFTSSLDRTIKIWNSNDYRAEPIQISGHDSWIYSICLSKDKKKLISADAGGQIMITVVDVGTLKNLVKGNLTQNMSIKNWEKFVGEGIEYSPNLPEDL